MSGEGSLDGPAADEHFCAEALRMLEAADLASLRQFAQAMLDGGDFHGKEPIPTTSLRSVGS